MIVKLVAAATLVPLVIVMGGCATAPPTPESCTMNYTATGAVVGAAAGAALGIGIAAIANATGQGFGMAAIGGALIGGIAGAIAGQQQDKACHAMALKQALDDAAEVARARRAGTADRPAPAPAAAPAPAQAQAVKAAPTATAQPAAYQTVAWANRMTNNSGSITPLGPVEEAPAEAVCMTYVDQQVVRGKTESVTGKACRGPDGEWKPMS
jgi:surface antigen